ncbi:hypothetical protein L596_001232 [Steinernema carpocapsae]|uniref:Uncharacterized protein n=1 Tax=Steinernema carpocapsae TaxID=34508 RepID=A0A4U8UPP3_STECR|nr:hypothetical protein L596_001232 [Steinernema carpocapsae]
MCAHTERFLFAKHYGHESGGLSLKRSSLGVIEWMTYRKRRKGHEWRWPGSPVARMTRANQAHTYTGQAVCTADSHQQLRSDSVLTKGLDTEHETNRLEKPDMASGAWLPRSSVPLAKVQRPIKHLRRTDATLKKLLLFTMKTGVENELWAQLTPGR